jgi:beta-N-acetylhexosaminidase
MKSLVLALTLLVSTAASWIQPEAGLRPPTDTAEQLLARMSPEERVGQLFLITFDGPQPEQPILDLLSFGYVSGVILSAAGDNFAASPNTLTSAAALIERLQTERIDRLEDFATAEPAEEPPGGVFVPLLIGVSLNQEGTPYPEILNGLSEPVTPMALGATWDAALAEAAGEQQGRELAALGFSLVLGPSLDVLGETSQRSAGDLGAETFGGDPFWISAVGSAFVSGLHAGGGGALGVVAKHFPGTGSSDRPPSEEVATVRKSLEELRLVDLAPFFAVTLGVPGEDPTTVDGLLLSHLRYQGLQGSIRQTTRPVSLDRAAVEQILALDTLPAWRTAGGVVVSDSLGSRAVRRFIDPSQQSFNGPQVAREAFLAGSDLLLLDDFISTGDPDAATTIRRTVEAFANRYRDDPVFADQADEAALRTRRLKLRLYGDDLDPDAVLDRPGADLIDPSEALAFRGAHAASRISPSEN